MFLSILSRVRVVSATAESFTIKFMFGYKIYR